MLTPGCFSECFDNMQVCERSSIAYSSIVAVVYSININNVTDEKESIYIKKGAI